MESFQEYTNQVGKNFYSLFNMLNDPIGDMLTRIRNANLRKLSNVSFNQSKIKENIIKVIQHEGFIEKYEIVEDKPCNKIKVYLKYQKNGQPFIRELTRISKPGLRIKKGYKELNPVLNSQGIRVITTSRGVKSDIECRQEKIGGEVICEIC